MSPLAKVAALALAFAFTQSCAHKSGHKHDDHDHDHSHDHGKKHDHDHDHDHSHDHSHDHDHSHHHHHHEGIKVSTIAKNGWALAKKIVVHPGQTTGWHSGPERLVVALSDYKIKYEEKGQKYMIKTWRMGDVHWHNAGEHNVTNVGKTPAEFLKIVRKGKLSGIKKSWTHKHNRSKYHKNLIDNHAVEVSEVTLKSGQKQKPHEGSYRAVIATSYYDVMYRQKGQKAVREKVKFGEVHFHTPGVHHLTNTGSSEANFIVVNFKK